MNGAEASPREVNSFLGRVQWYDLLNRSMLSTLRDVFGFVAQDDAERMQRVPTSVVDELALNIALFPCWVIDLTRGWMETLPVSDASEAFGLGFCTAQATTQLVREIASLPYDSDVFIRCQPEDGAPAERPRCGETFRLPFGLSRFKPVLSQKARWKSHSGGLEASAVAQGLRILSRSPGQHRRRGVFLVDARAVMGALRKGRTSAPTLWHPIRRCAALCLTCDWSLRFHYIPSESNAADWPSRGAIYSRERARQKRRLAQRSNGHVRKFSKLELALRHRAKAVETLRRNWPSVFSKMSGTESSEGAVSRQSSVSS
jgi:hypothetical protein